MSKMRRRPAPISQVLASLPIFGLSVELLQRTIFQAGGSSRLVGSCTDAVAISRRAGASASACDAATPPIKTFSPAPRSAMATSTRYRPSARRATLGCSARDVLVRTWLALSGARRPRPHNAAPGVEFDIKRSELDVMQNKIPHVNVPRAVRLAPRDVAPDLPKG